MQRELDPPPSSTHVDWLVTDCLLACSLLRKAFTGSSGRIRISSHLLIKWLEEGLPLLLREPPRMERCVSFVPAPRSQAARPGLTTRPSFKQLSKSAWEVSCRARGLAVLGAFWDWLWLCGESDFCGAWALGTYLGFPLWRRYASSCSSVLVATHGFCPPLPSRWKTSVPHVAAKSVPLGVRVDIVEPKKREAVEPRNFEVSFRPGLVIFTSAKDTSSDGCTACCGPSSLLRSGSKADNAGSTVHFSDPAVTREAVTVLTALVWVTALGGRGLPSGPSAELTLTKVYLTGLECVFSATKVPARVARPEEPPVPRTEPITLEEALGHPTGAEVYP